MICYTLNIVCFTVHLIFWETLSLTEYSLLPPCFGFCLCAGPSKGDERRGTNFFFPKMEGASSNSHISFSRSTPLRVNAIHSFSLDICLHQHAASEMLTGLLYPDAARAWTANPRLTWQSLSPVQDQVTIAGVNVLLLVGYAEAALPHVWYWFDVGEELAFINDNKSFHGAFTFLAQFCCYINTRD